jgi:hypothetical protein
MNTLRLLIVVITFAVAALAEGGTPPTSADKDAEALVRKVRFGNRELALPSALRVDQLQLAGDGLDNDIAQLEGRDKDLARITIDQFVIEHDKAAIQVSNWFAVIWSKTGDKELQDKLRETEKQFDEAQEKCRPHRDKREAFETLEEAEAACSGLHEIYRTVSQYHINSSVTPSVFKDDTARRTRAGYKLLMADELQSRVDAASHRPEKIKKDLIRYDQLLIDTDKLIWLQEILDADTVKYNAEHKEHPMAASVDFEKMLIGYRRDLAAICVQEQKELPDVRKGR